jgi:GNAT superfamily N-acetyltransferase
MHGWRVGSNHAAGAAIRRATVEDAELLALLGRDTFIETFGHLYPRADLEAFLAESYSPLAFAGFLADPRCALWIAARGNEALGFAYAGPCTLPHPEVTPLCGELKRLYMRRAAQGSGVGSQLLETTLRWLEARGGRLWIGVWSENLGAQRLYGRYGFRKVGEYEFPVGETRDREFILSR